jgi:hypothetical protein
VITLIVFIKVKLGDLRAVSPLDIFGKKIYPMEKQSNSRCDHLVFKFLMFFLLFLKSRLKYFEKIQKPVPYKNNLIYNFYIFIF